METEEDLGVVPVLVELTPNLHQFTDSRGKKREKLWITLSEYLNDLILDLAPGHDASRAESRHGFLLAATRRYGYVLLRFRKKSTRVSEHVPQR